MRHGAPLHSSHKTSWNTIWTADVTHGKSLVLH